MIKRLVHDSYTGSWFSGLDTGSWFSGLDTGSWLRDWFMIPALVHDSHTGLQVEKTSIVEKS